MKQAIKRMFGSGLPKLAALALAALASGGAQATKLGEGITAYYQFNVGSSFTGQKWDTDALVDDANLAFSCSGNIQEAGKLGDYPKFSGNTVLNGGSGGCYVQNAIADSAYPSTSGNWTISLWAKRNGATSHPCLYHHGPSATYTASAMVEPTSGSNGGIAIYVLSDGKVKVGFSVSSDGSTFSYNTIISSAAFTWANAQANWHNVVVKRDGTTVSLLVDGGTQGTSTISADAKLYLDASSKLSLSGTSAMGWQNSTEDLCFWNRALTDAEISTIAVGGAPISAMADYSPDDASLEESGYFVTTAPRLAFKNVTLAELTADTMRARMSGAWVSNKMKAMTFFNFADIDASTRTCEAQIDGEEIEDQPAVKSAFLTFTQVGDDVYCCVTAVKYKTNVELGTSASDGTAGTIATSATANGYGIYNLRLSRTDGATDAMVVWNAGEFWMPKTGVDGNTYTITRPASGISIDGTTGNLVVADSGATTGATVTLPSGVTNIAVIVKYSNLAASDSVAAISPIGLQDSSSYKMGLRTMATSSCATKGYFDTSNNVYPSSGDALTLPTGNGHLMMSYESTYGPYGSEPYLTFYTGSSLNSMTKYACSGLRFTASDRTISSLTLGGPVTTDKSVAWPGLVIKKVAIIVREGATLYSATDVANFELPPTAVATITSDGTYTLNGTNPLFDSIATDGEYVIDVRESATLNIPSATTVNMITFNVASGKVLTLTGSTLTATGGIKVTGAGSVSVSSATALAGILKGDGTVVYNGVMPSGVTLNNAAWTGTVEINTISTKTGLVLNNLGSVNSTVRVSAITDAYFNDSGTVTANPTLEIGSGGLTIAYGNGGAITVLKKLTGSGNITITGGAQATNGLVIQNHEGFSGQISNTIYNRWQVTIGNSGTSAINGKMIVNNGYTANISNGKTWSFLSGFEVSGILAFNGTGMASGPVSTASGSTLDFSAATSDTRISGTLTLASGTTIKLPSGATLPYQIASAGDGWANNVTVEIDGGATVTGGVKLSGGVLSSVKAATISTAGAATFSSLSWSGTGDVYLLTISGSPALLTFDDVSGVEELKIVVENNGQLYVAGDLPENFSVDGLTALTVADNETLSLAADYTRLYSQIGTISTGNGAISSSGTTISVANAMNALALTAGNYTIARWLTPQVLSTGYGAVAAPPSVTVADGLTAELVYMVDRIVLRVYDATAQAAKGTLKIWPYGDSITEGYNVSNTRANYRVLLGQKLKLLGYNVEMVGCFDKVQTSSMQDAIDPAGQTIPPAWKWHSAKHGGTIGITSATSYQRSSMLESVDTHCAQVGNPDVVLLHGGINDLYATDQTVQSVFDNWTNVVEHILTDLPNTKVVVSTLLYCNAADSGRKTKNSTLVEPFNTAVKNFLASPPATWSGRVFLADLNSYFAASRDDAAPAGTTVDNLHPDWWGHDEMAEGWLSVVTNQFTASQTFPSATAIVAPTSGERGAANKAELDDYRRGFKRYGVINVANNLDPSNYTYSDVDATAATSGIARVGYFVEYVRADNNVSHWVWVDMDAFGTTIADLGLPAANHQQVVNNLHVKSSHNGIDDVAADDNSVQGWIEFSPFTYTGASSGVTGAPLRHGAATGTYSMYDWDDKLDESGAKGCMQVFRKATPSGRPAQTLFAFNNWNQNETQAEFGIGNFSQHFHGGLQTFDYTETASLSQMNASAYSVKTIEIWTNPDRLEYSNDKRGSSVDGATFNAGAETWTITIPGSGSAVIDEISLGLRSNNDTERAKLTTVRLAIYTSGGDLVATSDLMNGDGSEDLTTKFADGGYRQRFAFSKDCVLERGTAYTLKFLNSSGADGVWPATLENATGASDYSPIVNTTLVTAWRVAQTIYASKLYEATLPTIANTFSGLTFSPALPPDPSGSALLVNVPTDTTATLTFGSATTVGSMRFNIPDGSSLTIADPSNLTTDKIVVYGSGTLSFGASPDFGDADIEIVDDATLALAAGQTLATTGDVTVDSGATVTLAPATISSTSASLISAATISGEFDLTAPDEGSDYSLSVTSTAVTLLRVTKEAFKYDPYPGQNTPTGWITSWGGEGFDTTSMRIGPSSTVPYVYYVKSGNHPWKGLTARATGFSYAIYADVSQMESDKGVITAFGNTTKGLFLYREGDWVKLAHVVNGSITTSDWVPGVPVSAGYHLYTVTYDPTTGAAALYLDGSTVAKTTGEGDYQHLGTQGLNAGFQIGSIYQGTKYDGSETGFKVGAGLAVCSVRGYDVVLDSVEVGVLAESFPATDGNVSWDVNPEVSAGNSYIVTSTTVDDSHYLGITLGTLTIPEGSTVSTKHVRVLNSGYTDDRATVNIAGTLNVTSTSSNPNVWAERESLKGILFGHWHGQATYNVTGSLIGTNAYLETVYTAEAQTVNINGGTVAVKGLYAANGNSTVNLENGGRLEVSEIPSGGSGITYNFVDGTYRITGGNATVSTPIRFSGTSSAPTTIDPYGNEITMTAESLYGNGYIIAADSSAAGDGKVIFPASTPYFSGYVVLNDDNGANIDISGYTGKVLLDGTNATTIARLEGFKGTVFIYKPGTYHARGVDLTGIAIQVGKLGGEAGIVLEADAGMEGNVTVMYGTCKLYVDNNTFLYEGHIFNGLVNDPLGILTYCHSEDITVSGTSYSAGDPLSTDVLAVVRPIPATMWNLLPYYKIFVGDPSTVTAGTYYGSTDNPAHWNSGVVQTDGNVAFKVEAGKTLVVDVSTNAVFNEVQVITYGSPTAVNRGTLVFRSESGDKSITVTNGIYTASMYVDVEIESGFEFSAEDNAGIHVMLFSTATVNCGTEADRYEVPYLGGAGEVIVSNNCYVAFDKSEVYYLTVNGDVVVSNNLATVENRSAFRVSQNLKVNSNGVMTMMKSSCQAAGLVITVDDGGLFECEGSHLDIRKLIVNGTGTAEFDSDSLLELTPYDSYDIIATGNGTVRFIGKLPDGTWWTTAGDDASNGWRGTVAIKDWNSSGSSPWTPADYGNQYSTLEADNCNVYHFAGSGDTALPTLKLAGNLTINNGSSSAVNNFAGLSGSGNLTIVKQSGAPTQTLRFANGADYTGSITNANFKLVFGTSGGEGATITVNSGATAGLGDGATWKSDAIKIGGTLDVKGVGTLEVTSGNAVTINGGATISLANAPLTVNGSVTLPTSATFAINPGVIDITDANGVGVPLITGITASDDLADGKIMTTATVTGATTATFVVAKTNGEKRDIVVYKRLPVVSDATAVKVPIAWMLSNARTAISGQTTIGGVETVVKTARGANGCTYLESYALGLTPSNASSVPTAGMTVNGDNFEIFLSNAVVPEGVVLGLSADTAAPGGTFADAENDTPTSVAGNGTNVSGSKVVIPISDTAGTQRYRLKISISGPPDPAP